MSEDEIILTHILNCRRIDLHVDKPALSKEQQRQFDEYKVRRAAGEPLQYILGSCNFFGLEFKVNPAVLVPRPETEILVEEALRRFKGNAILDIGTGSGCIAVTLAKNLPHTRVTAVDVSADALTVARENAVTHGVADRIDFVQADILSAVIPVPTFSRDNRESRTFDLIVSNPPYIPSAQISTLPKDVQKEPCLALDGGEDGLTFYKSLIKYSPSLLRKGACLMMEFGDGQGSAIRAIFDQGKAFSGVEILKDLTGKERIMCGKICH